MRLKRCGWHFAIVDIIISMRKCVHFPVDINLYNKYDNLSSHTQISHNELKRVDNA